MRSGRWNPASMRTLRSVPRSSQTIIAMSIRRDESAPATSPFTRKLGIVAYRIANGPHPSPPLILTALAQAMPATSAALPSRRRIRNFGCDIGLTECILIFAEQRLDTIELLLHSKAIIGPGGEVEEERAHCLRVDDEAVMADLGQCIGLHFICMVGRVRRLGA